MNATIEFPTLNYGDTLCVSIPSVYIPCEANFLYPFLVEKTRKYFRKEELMFYFYICYEKYRNDLKLSSAFNNKITVFLKKTQISLLKLTFKRDSLKNTLSSE